ncbi:MAG: hypothetical protein N2038_13020 [Geminicoccaceae bacterium]|nr:hypothetical protein [Geminicoccaceae bacterium]MCS7268620.1 hypothetical protein [Geminicoccaceae bacterium]MCX7631155.1 hypothetical protein [Geminicoccaceae bacterium]MDW8125349.1 hypothetical protein [Geminicoccaceae bacterium]MDW8342627.1 hypothetical protein [Geminicoccaceae bacterium]
MIVVLRLLAVAVVLGGAWWIYQAWSQGRLAPPPSTVEVPAKGAYRGAPDTPLPPERKEELDQRANRMRF